MASIFEQTIVPKINFSNFDLSESNLLTCNFGQLIPCFVREVLPNDVFTLGASAICNFAPMVAPMYQDIHVSMHFFYVPNRLVWDDFETFITGAVEGYALPADKMPVQAGLTIKDLTDIHQDFLLSQDLPTNWQGTLLDYFGLPNNLWVDYQNADDYSWAENVVISDLLLRDYFKIWFDYYRDENLQAEITHVDTKKYLMYDDWKAWRAASNGLSVADDSEDWVKLNNYFLPRYRAFKKDYFTACLPSPQKGEPVTIGLTGNAPVSFDDKNTILYSDNGIRFGFGSSLSGRQSASFQKLLSDNTQAYIQEDDQETNALSVAGKLKFEDGTPFKGSADLSKATAITVEQLREAFAVQEILESLSMRGSRFTEFLKGNFGVTPDDYRLQRPQFLGGLVTPVQVQQILQQSGYSEAQTPDSRNMTGYAAGRAFAGVGGRVFKQRFKEHGYILGIMSVMPKAYYYQGIPRHFLRKDLFDYYLPQTAHLGEQGVQNMELYFSSKAHNVSDNENVFGYIPRWAEYKTSTNGIHGDFRGNLNYYHMARTFSNSSLPSLSEEFISTENVPTRPFAVWQTENPTINHLCWVNCYFKVIASRPMPYHSIPKVL